MEFKKKIIVTVLSTHLCGCGILSDSSDKFLELSEFYPAVLASGPPKEKKVSTSASSVTDTPTLQDGLDKEIVIDNPDVFETDYGISEELQRELLEAEAKLKQPTISIDN